MFKRSLVLSLLCLTCLPIAYAGYTPSFYVGPTVMYQGISSKNIDYMGITPRLSVGFGGVVNDSFVYLGAEIFGSPKGASIHNRKDGTPGLQPKYSVGASFIPGYYLDDVMLLYARLGVIDTKFDNLDASRWGAQAGIGIEASLTRSWSVRGDYTYTSYRTVKNYIGSPKASEYAIGLLYRFGGC